MSASRVVPATCDRVGCEKPVAWVLHYEEIGAPEPAFACFAHGGPRHGNALRVGGVRREHIADYMERGTE